MMPQLEISVVKWDWRIAVYANGVKRWEGDEVHAYKSFVAISKMVSFQPILVVWYEVEDSLDYFKEWPNGFMDILDEVGALNRTERL